jgi:hypothetical protein
MTAICPACGEECGVKADDQGYGWTEAWGIWKNDVRIVPVSDCCEEVIEDLPEPEPDYPDYDD